MIHVYEGSEQMKEFHDRISELLGEGYWLYSPGGAANFARTTRQNIHKLTNENRVEAWYYYEKRAFSFGAKGKRLTYGYVNMVDVASWALGAGRLTEADIPDLYRSAVDNVNV